MALAAIAASLGGIVDGLRVMLTGLAINSQDKAKIDEILANLEKAIEVITTATGGEIIVRESDVEAAVAAVLPAMVSAEVTKQLSMDTKGSPENEQSATDTVQVKND